MGSLFGFSGVPDREIVTRIDAALRHRSDQPLRVDERADGVAGVRPATLGRPPPGALTSGIARDGELAVALSGALFEAPADETGTPSLLALLQRFRAEGIALLASLRGQFSLCLRDADRFHLVRDGAGARTLYYAIHRGRLAFANEPKGVLAFPGLPRRIRPGAVAQYLTFSFVPGGATMLEDLYELPAGHVLSWSPHGEGALHRYFRFEERDADAPERPDARWVAEFRDRLERAVARRLPPAGEPTAVFLSGGIDSSAVAAEVARLAERPVHTFAVHFGERYPNELDFAREVATRIGSVHEEVRITPREFVPRLRRMVWHLDEPVGDPVTMPNFELAARVGREFRYAFNGEGGDPCFGGPKNIPMLLHHWYGGLRRRANFREQAYLESYRRGYEEIDRLLSPEWRTLVDPERDLEGLLTPFFACPHARGFLDKLAAINIRLKGAHLILPKVDRMLAGFGLQPLSPLFDEDLVRLGFEMPARMRLDRGVEKVIIKQAFRDRLPASVVERPKSGMRVPVHYWFRGEMKRYARRLLSPRALRDAGIFDPERVRKLLRYETAEGPGRFGLRIWMLVTFELWRRIVVEGEAV